MNTIMKISIAVIFAALVAVSFNARTFAQEAAPAESYTIALPMIVGFEDTQIVDVFKQVGEVVGKKLGVEVLFKSLPFQHDDDLFTIVQKAFKNKEADISYVNGRDHGLIQLDNMKGYNVLAVLGMNKSTIEKACFYTRVGEFKEVEELRGKKWRGASLVTPRFLLYKNGIDETLESFFDVRGFDTDSPIGPLLDKLKSGEVDVITTYYHTMWLTGELKKKEPVIEAMNCVPMESHWVFVARNGLPPERIEQVRKLFQNAHKDPDFKQFGFAFMMIDGHFMPMDDKAAALNKDFAKLIRDRKWREEEIAFFKKYIAHK